MCGCRVKRRHVQHQHGLPWSQRGCSASRISGGPEPLHPRGGPPSPRTPKTLYTIPRLCPRLSSQKTLTTTLICKNSLLLLIIGKNQVESKKKSESNDAFCWIIFFLTKTIYLLGLILSSSVTHCDVFRDLFPCTTVISTYMYVMQGKQANTFGFFLHFKIGMRGECCIQD